MTTTTENNKPKQKRKAKETDNYQQVTIRLDKNDILVLKRVAKQNRLLFAPLARKILGQWVDDYLANQQGGTN